MAHDLKYGRITAELGDRVHGKPGVPLNESDEPCFVIRAQDAAARGAIEGWIDEARELGASPATLGAAHEALDAIRAWQAAHRNLVKVPD